MLNAKSGRARQKYERATHWITYHFCRHGRHKRKKGTNESQKEGRKERRKDGWMDEQMDGQMKGWRKGIRD